MLARIVAAVLPVPNGGEEVAEQTAKAMQTVIDIAPVTTQAFMETIIRQHGVSPAQLLNNIQIEQAIEKDSAETQS